MIFKGTNIIIYIPFVLLNNYDGLNGVLIKPNILYIAYCSYSCLYFIFCYLMVIGYRAVIKENVYNI